MQSVVLQTLKSFGVNRAQSNHPLKWSNEKIIWVALRVFAEISLVFSVVSLLVGFIAGGAAGSTPVVVVGVFSVLSALFILWARVFKLNRLEPAAALLSFSDLRALYSVEEICRCDIVSHSILVEKIHSAVEANNREDIGYIRENANQLRSAIRALSFSDRRALFELEELFKHQIAAEWQLIGEIHRSIKAKDTKSAMWIAQNIESLFARGLVGKNVLKAFKGQLDTFTRSCVRKDILQISRLASRID